MALGVSPSREDFFDDVPVHVCQPEIAAGVTIGESGVVEPEQLHEIFCHAGTRRDRLEGLRGRLSTIKLSDNLIDQV